MDDGWEVAREGGMEDMRREENGGRDMGGDVELEDDMPELEEIEIEREVDVVDLTGESGDSGHSEEEGMGHERGGREGRVVLRPDWVE